jgi:hypothetical protein
MDLLAVYLGDRLGYYRALPRGAGHAAELAERTGTAERYAREWLEQQAASAILSCANPEAEPGAAASPCRRLRGRAGRPGEPDHDGPAAPDGGRLGPAAAGAAGGLPDGRRRALRRLRRGPARGQARFTRPLFVHQLAQEWLPLMPEVHARLGQPGARVADVGMGQGYSSIAFAKGYPGLRVDGFDLDEASVAARGGTPRRRAWPTGSASRSATPATRGWPAGTTWPSPSSASTT